MQKVIEENKKVEDDINRRQDRYIKREMDYRQNIEELQAQLRIRLDNGDSSDEDELEGEDAQGQRFKRKYDPVVQKLKKQFLDSVANIDPRVEQMGQEQQKDIIRKFNSEMIKMKKKLEDQKSFKGDQEGDLKERENEMQHNLELITSIAQRIDNENRLLIKKNAELK